MAEDLAVAFRDRILRDLGRIAAESRDRMMDEAAAFGAATLLIEHFGAEQLRSITLPEQLRFLLHESHVEPKEKRVRLTIAWMSRNAGQIKSTEELIEFDKINAEILEICFSP